MLVQVSKRDERRIVGSYSGSIMGGVGLQGHAMFSTRTDFNVQVCGCLPEWSTSYSPAHKHSCLLQKTSINVLNAVLQKHYLFSYQSPQADTWPHLEQTRDVPFLTGTQATCSNAQPHNAVWTQATRCSSDHDACCRLTWQCHQRTRT